MPIHASGKTFIKAAARQLIKRVVQPLKHISSAEFAAFDEAGDHRQADQASFPSAIAVSTALPGMPELSQGLDLFLSNDFIPN